MPERFGKPLQDAAVTANADPNVILPPTNAGQADPHGPSVVAIEVGDPRRDAAIKAARAVLRQTLDSTPGLTYREQELR